MVVCSVTTYCGIGLNLLTCLNWQIQHESSPTSFCKHSPPLVWEVHTSLRGFSSLDEQRTHVLKMSAKTRPLHRYNIGSISPSRGVTLEVHFTYVSLSHTSLTESLCPLSVPNIQSGS